MNSRPKRKLGKWLRNINFQTNRLPTISVRVLVLLGPIKGMVNKMTAKYIVSKISVSTFNMDGSDTYDYDFKYSTWAELTRDMHDRARYANEIFHGRGATIERNGIEIGNTQDFNRHDAPINKITLTDFIELNKTY